MFKSKPKRSVKTTPNPGDAKLLFQVQQMKEPYRSYAAFLYLIGARVSEGIGLRKGKENITKPLTRLDFEEREDFLYVNNIPVLKTKDRHLVTKYVNNEDLIDKEFIKILKDYLETRKPEEPLWTFSRSAFWLHLNKATGLFPHKLRGLRATKDVVDFNMNIVELKQKHGWSQDKTPLEYLKLSQSDIIAKIRRNVRR